MKIKFPYITSKKEKLAWYNKPVKSKDWKHKKVVYAKKWDKAKLVRYGATWYSDFTKHKDKDRRKRYRDRHRWIKDKTWKPAYKNKLSPAYRSWNDLR